MKVAKLFSSKEDLATLFLGVTAEADGWDPKAGLNAHTRASGTDDVG